VIQDFACNGTVVKSEELGEVIQLQGDQRNKVFEFLSKTLGMKPRFVTPPRPFVMVKTNVFPAPSKFTGSKHTITPRLLYARPVIFFADFYSNTCIVIKTITALFRFVESQSLVIRLMRRVCFGTLTQYALYPLYRSLKYW